MNLNDNVVYRCLRVGPLHQLHPGRSRSLVRHNDRLHDNFLLGHLSLWWKCCSVGKPVRHLMPGAMGSFRKRRSNSALPVVDVTSLSELLGARQRLDQGHIMLHSRLPPPFGAHGSVNPKKGCCRKRAVKSSVAKEAADREKNPSSNGRDEAQHAIKECFLISRPELILDAAFELPNVERQIRSAFGT